MLGLGHRVPSHDAQVERSLVHYEGKQLRIETDQHALLIDTQTLRLFRVVDFDLDGQVCLSHEGNELQGLIEDYDYRTLLTHEGALCVDVNLYGSFQLGNDKVMAFSCAMQIAASGERVDVSLTVHNPAAAQHPEGLWDLGDVNSLLFDSLSLGLRWEDKKGAATSGEIQINPEQASMPFACRAVLTQLASGGEHWDSPVHQNPRGEILLKEPGFVARIDDQELQGTRADPNAHITRGRHRVSVRLEDFWQRFPSQLSLDNSGVTVDLLPQTQVPHELQAGERCTHRCTFHFTENATPETEQGAATFPQPLITLEPAHIEFCELPEIGTSAAIDPRIQRLINQGLDGENNFFNKREAIDEYGWRNFGDLWADHETEGYDGEKLFVSHYNNQYDPLFGFLRQYLRSGKPSWLELAGDLARHTVDIDIYHTDKDRAEYNNGLFWHTDHYLQAETSSHRSYSGRQPKDAYEGHSHGGGPGGQHCYTTGLLYHYLVTGERSSRDALYELTDWIGRVYEGSGTLTDVLLALKNRKRPDLKNHLTGQYPLDRGVANYLHALMDCHALDRAPTTLRRLAKIIQHTVHPSDDLSTRALENVEEHWYYVVFLQALCRYLALKADLNQLDTDFVYARDCLLHYADWMVANEAPYLSKPDILEFPNHTWTAQDLRKVNVLFWADYWSADNSQAYASKASELADYIASTLSTEPSRQYTRILALLMQNENPSLPLAGALLQIPKDSRYPGPRSVGVVAQASNFVTLLFRALLQFRPSREWAALQKILPAPTSRTQDS